MAQGRGLRKGEEVLLIGYGSTIPMLLESSEEIRKTLGFESTVVDLGS